MSRAALSIALVLAALSVAAVGCGGGGSSQTGSNGSPPAGTQTFAEKADSVCAKTQEQIETEYVAFLKKNQIKELGENGESQQEAEAHGLEVIETIGIPQLRRQLNELRALEAPKDTEAQVNAYLDAVEEEIETGEQDPQSLSGPANKVFAKSDAAAQGIGFKVCGNH